MRGTILALKAAAVAAALALPVVAMSRERGGTSPRLVVDKMYPTSRARLALARVRGEKSFEVILASEPKHNDAVTFAIESVGGSVLYRADDVDFIEARLPIDRIETIAGRADVTSIAADDSVAVLSISSGGPSPSPSPLPTHAPRSPADEGPLFHPYRPQTSMGIDALRKVHPEFDGRGTVVALLDPGPDFLLPELQQARAADGRIVPKFVDMIAGALPNGDDAASPWVAVSTPVHAEGGAFVVSGVTYRAPHDGDFYFSLAHNFLIAEIAGIAKWSGDPDKALLPILWDRASGTVWVDTARSDDFSAAKGLHDYHVAHEYATFAIPVTDAQARPTLGFAVQTDTADGKVALLPGYSDHASMTAGAIAANEDDGGRFEGVAPQAQLFSIDEGGNFTSVIHSALLAERDSRVDVVCLVITGPTAYAWRDGRFVESVIFERAVRKYGKPLLQAAGNDFGMSILDEPCVPADITCVGAYESSDSYEANDGLILKGRDHFHWVTSFGPAGNGALEPSFLAPSGWIALGVGYEAAAGIKGVFDLPPGYDIGGGTSQATPTAAGALDVLIGAERTSETTVTPAQLLAALEWTARYIPSLPAFGQGSGLLQVDAAFALLERWKRHPAASLTFQAPVRTIDSQFLPVPNTGPGLFEREGWAAGFHGTRFVEVTRRNGSPNVQRYTIELLGNDGTFAAQPAIALPLNDPRTIRLRIAPKEDGAHSSILRLLDASGTIAGQTLLTIVAGEQFTAANHYVAGNRIGVPRPGMTSVFVTVPAKTQALVVRVASPTDGLQFSPHEPDGMDPADRTNNLLTAFPLVHGRLQLVFRYPRPGTWEFVLDDMRDLFLRSPGITVVRHPTEVTVTASIVGAALAQERNRRMLSVKRRLSSFPAGLTALPAWATQTTYAGTVKPGTQQIYPLAVPRGTRGIFVTLASSPAASPDLYLFDCSGRACSLRERSTTFGSTRRLYYNAPAAGHWKLVVDGFAISPRGSNYQLHAYVIGNFHCRQHVPIFTVDLPGNDPLVYVNEGGAGELARRTNVNPVVFDAIVPFVTSYRPIVGCATPRNSEHLHSHKSH